MLALAGALLLTAATAQITPDPDGYGGFGPRGPRGKNIL